MREYSYPFLERILGMRREPSLEGKAGTEQGVGHEYYRAGCPLAVTMRAAALSEGLSGSTAPYR